MAMPRFVLAIFTIVLFTGALMLTGRSIERSADAPGELEAEDWPDYGDESSSQERASAVPSDGSPLISVDACGLVPG